MRAEEIMDAVVTAVTGLTTTTTNVRRARVYDWNVTPSLSVYMGQDDVVNELVNDLIDWEIIIIVESHVKAESNVDQTINTIRKEVHSALMADHTLGLNFVHDITPGPAGEPELEAGDQPIASQRIEFKVMYRTSRTALDA